MNRLCIMSSFTTAEKSLSIGQLVTEEAENRFSEDEFREVLNNNIQTCREETKKKNDARERHLKSEFRQKHVQRENAEIKQIHS